MKRHEHPPAALLVLHPALSYSVIPGSLLDI